MLRIGPVPGAMATEIVGELTLAGIPAKVTVRDERRLFRVVSGPMSAEAARSVTAVLAGDGLPTSARALPDGSMQLDFGVYPTAAAAETVAGRARRQDVAASVVVEGGAVITVGPHPQATIDEIVRTLRGKSRIVTFAIRREQ